MKWFEKGLSRPARATIAGVAVLVAICFASSFAVAGTLPTSTVLPNYAIVSVGSSASLKVNSGPINGRVLIGDGSNATSSGGNNGSVTGGVDVSPPVTGDNLTHIQTPPVVSMVPSTIGMQAFSDAATLSATAAGLTATQTFGAINGTQVITGNGALNVIDIASLQNPTLTISGSASDIFVINVAGLFQTNHAITLSGVTASQILWNFTGTGTVLQTSGGNQLFGTFLATNGGSFTADAIHLTGALINTGGHIEFVSGAQLTFEAFIVPQQKVPEPEATSLLLCGMGLVAGAGVLRRETAARFRHIAVKLLGVEHPLVPGLASSSANRSA